MRLCFIIACMAGIGVGLIHLRKRESIARHELLSLDTEHELLRRTAHQQDSDRGNLMSPRQTAHRAKTMNIDTERQPVRLAGPAERRRLQNTHRITN